MNIYSLTVKGLMITILGSPLVVISPRVEAKELPDFLYSKGGIIYPQTGDSSQDIFRTPSNIKDYIEPGMLIGVLPVDCKSASRGTIGSFYICDHELFLKPEQNAGKTVYRVIELK